MIIVAGGSYSGDLLGVHSAEIDGKIVGDICVWSLILGPHSVVHGDITCKSFTVDRDAVIVGQLNISPEIDLGIDALNQSIAVLNESIVHDEEVVEEKKKYRLVVICPQVDLYSNSTDLEAANKIAEFISTNSDSIEDIVVTLDSHHVYYYYYYLIDSIENADRT